MKSTEIPRCRHSESFLGWNWGRKDVPSRGGGVSPESPVLGCLPYPEDGWMGQGSVFPIQMSGLLGGEVAGPARLPAGPARKQVQLVQLDEGHPDCTGMKVTAVETSPTQMSDVLDDHPEVWVLGNEEKVCK